MKEKINIEKKDLKKILDGMTAFAALVAVLFSTLAVKAQSAPSVSESDAPQAVFTNSAEITFGTGGPNNGSLYPSPINVTGLSGNIPTTPGSIKVTINNFSHTFASDVGFVLVGPTGAAFLIQDVAGGEDPVSGVTYTLSDTGATFLPETSWTAGTYKPTSYFLGDSFPAPGPLTAYANPGPASGGTATFSSVFGGTNPNGTWNLFTRDFITGDGGSIAGGWTLEIDTGAPTGGCTTAKRPLDFDGDGKTDPTVVRNTGGGPSGAITWYIKNSSGMPFNTTRQWGQVGDDFVPADYDGDGKSDIAVWRGGTVQAPQGYFYILQSQTNTFREDIFGQTGDDPTVIGDYTGDGKVDPAVYRAGTNTGNPSFWFYRASSGPLSGQIVYNQWGQNGDFPAPGDYDGDGRYDFVVQRNGGGGSGQFFLNQTTAGQTSFLFGQPSDVIVPGYYDNDCKTDIAVRRSIGGSINWFIRNSTNGATQHFIFGVSATDFSTQGDYDGDGVTDISVYRTNADPALTSFYWRRSSDGASVGQQWGQNGDYPAANYNSH